MYIKILCNNQSLGDKYKASFIDECNDGESVVQIHCSPGNLVGWDVIVDEKLDSDRILIKGYDNGIFAYGDMPSGVGLGKADSWWKGVGFAPVAIYDSSKVDDANEGVAWKAVESACSDESDKYRGDDGEPNSAWEENNVELSDL